MGIFDEGCMGMYNAIIPDELLFPLGVFKERLSQSALYAASRTCRDAEARAVYDWLVKKGMTFHFGNDPETDLDARPGARPVPDVHRGRPDRRDFGCDAIGIQYQQGLKDLLPASDLAEGMLNNADRPPVKTATAGRSATARRSRTSTKWTNAPASTPCSPTGCTARSASRSRPRCTTSAGATPTAAATTSDYVWVFQISGAAPPAHHIGGWAGTDSLRQPPMYFRLGGGTVRGIAKPGAIVWSRDLRRGRPAEDGPRPRPGGRAAAGRDRAALERHDAAMADHARRAAWRVARPDDGPPQGEPHPGRLRELRRGGRPRAWRPRRRWRRNSASKSRSAAQSPTERRSCTDARASICWLNRGPRRAFDSAERRCRSLPCRAEKR